MLIDSHCHLNFDYSPKSAADLIREAGEADVRFLVTIGTEMKAIPELEALSEKHTEVFHTVGVHPHDSIEMLDEDLAALAAAAAHPKCRAIGEIGLDYHYAHSPPPVQVRRLREQLDLAIQVKQPIVIHSREAEAELLSALRDYAGRVPGAECPGVIHCFTGTKEFGLACIELGFLISFSGILTFKNAEDLRDCARTFPLNHLLVETDAPFLAPIPFRGKKCEPVMVRQTALKLAELKNVAIDEIERATTENARRLFRIG